MCLNDIRDKFSSPTTLIQDGWKKFNGPPDAPKFATMSWHGKHEVPLDVWIAAELPKISQIRTSDNNKVYTLGFHIYEDEKQASSQGATRRVYYRRVHTRGTQNDKSVVIANEMYVPSNPNDWPPLR